MSDALAQAKSAIRMAEEVRVAAHEECAVIAESLGREFGEPAIGGAIATAIRKLNAPR